jgi:hypothetical protein
MLARMLGIHIAVAVQWQQASSGDWTAYAADISQRRRPVAKVEHTLSKEEQQHAGMATTE